MSMSPILTKTLWPSLKQSETEIIIFVFTSSCREPFSRLLVCEPLLLLKVLRNVT